MKVTETLFFALNKTVVPCAGNELQVFLSFLYSLQKQTSMRHLQDPDTCPSFHKDNDKKALSKAFPTASFFDPYSPVNVRIEDSVLIRENIGQRKTVF